MVAGVFLFMRITYERNLSYLIGNLNCSMQNKNIKVPLNLFWLSLYIP